METIDFEVKFDKYCKTCVHEKLDGKLDPCHECLSQPTNVNSAKPVCYKEDEEKVKKEAKNGEGS